jgi:hypothetical protein
MPSPLGHTIAGLITHVATAPHERLRDVRRAALLVVCANAADLDFAWRLLDGRNHHQAQTHSVGAAAIAGLVVAAAAVARMRDRADAVRLGIASCAAWLTHVLLDWLGNDTNPPIGLMALWPFDHSYWKSSLIVFYDVGRTPDWEMVRNNALAGAWEIAVLAPLLFVAWRLRRHR